MSLTRTTVPLIGLAALAALVLTGKPAAADTINFSGLTGAYNAIISGPYTENGFTVNFTSGKWEKDAYGNPDPSITTFDGGTIDVTRTGQALFTFSSVDLEQEGNKAGYTFTGLHGTTTVFLSTGFPVATFTTFASPDSTSLIDDLKIKLSNPENAYPVGLDNIVVQSAVTPVPESSSVVSLGLGTLGLGGLVLRARKRKVQSA